MDKYDLDIPLIDLISSSGKSAFTIRHSVEGILICGGIGSGKSSGSGRLISQRLLVAGYGGLVLCAKKEEKEVWQEYCRLAGREKDLIIIEPVVPILSISSNMNLHQPQASPVPTIWCKY